MNWRIAGALSCAGVAVLLWLSRLPDPQSQPSFESVGAGASVNLDVRNPAADARQRLESRETGSQTPLARGLSIGAKDRPQRFRRTFRRLPAHRDPEIQKDPQFQKLMETDAARKMALVAHDDREELKNTLTAIKQPAATIDRRVLEAALVDPSTEVRLAALAEISLEMDPPPLDLLGPVVEGDPDAEVRLEALEIVGESGSEEAVAVIRTALSDPVAAIRAEAEDLLEDSQD
jgi:hypothetical protein